MASTDGALYQAGISKRNRAALERLHRDAGPAFDAATASRVLETDQAEATRLLGYLSRRGWLSRVRRGLYLPVPLDARRPGEWIEDSWIVADRVFAPCYIGGWSACEHWDLTEQLFRSLLVVTARQIHEREVEMQGIPFRLTQRPEDKLFGTVAVWRNQTRVQVSDAPRTLVDILDDPRLGGGIRTCADVVGEYMRSKHRADSALLEYGDRLGNRTVFKRLGYLLEHTGVDAPELVGACLDRRSAGLTTLDPSVDSPGRIVRRWGLRVNVAIRSESDHS